MHKSTDPTTKQTILETDDERWDRLLKSLDNHKNTPPELRRWNKDEIDIEF